MHVNNEHARVYSGVLSMHEYTRAWTYIHVNPPSTVSPSTPCSNTLMYAHAPMSPFQLPLTTVITNKHSSSALCCTKYTLAIPSHRLLLVVPPPYPSPPSSHPFPCGDTQLRRSILPHPVAINHSSPSVRLVDRK